jgi:hypothetical protein
MPDNKLTPVFAIGDRVRGIAYTDCFHKLHDATAVLVVTHIEIVNNSAPHVRVTANGEGPLCQYEARQEMFANA